MAAIIIPFPCRMSRTEAGAALAHPWSPEFRAGVDWAMHLLNWLQEQRAAEAGDLAKALPARTAFEKQNLVRQ